MSYPFTAASEITLTKMDAPGYVHIRGRGPCNWCQPPWWPATEEEIRAHAFPEASEEFLREVIDVSRRLIEADLLDAAGLEG